ncbi:tetraspanin-19 isoform X3 [Pseudophryne corroboree]|uniref:tetraspanin-19 isoform X3 n=1 Tax=Pseudophryne corroboree TaxID=495146 RepID=UPI003081FAB2
MKQKDKIKVLKYVFFIINIILLVLGMLNMGFGLWIKYDKRTMFSFFELELYTFYTFPIVFTYAVILVGAATCFACFFGFLGAVKEVRMFLLVFAGLLCLLFTSEVIIHLPILVFCHKGLILNIFLEKINAVISQYTKKKIIGNEQKLVILDTIQQIGCKDAIIQWYNNNIATMSGLMFLLLITEVLQIALSIILIKKIHQLNKVNQKS